MASAVPRPHPNGDNTEYKKIKNICSICEISVRLNKTFCVRLNITLRVGFSKLSARHAASVAALLDLMGVYEKSPEPFQARGSGGGYLLSHFRSTIGVVRLNFSVRNGKRWIPHAITTLVFFSVKPLLLIAAPVYLGASLTDSLVCLKFSIRPTIEFSRLEPFSPVLRGTASSPLRGSTTCLSFYGIAPSGKLSGY